MICKDIMRVFRTIASAKRYIKTSCLPMSLIVVPLLIALYQKHTLFWSFILVAFHSSFRKTDFCFAYCVIAINKCSYLSPWKEQLCISDWMKRISLDDHRVPSLAKSWLFICGLSASLILSHSENASDYMVMSP